MDFQANRGCEVFEWPYPVHYEKTIHVNTDVLVIGGGLAAAEKALCHSADCELLCVRACPGGCLHGGAMPRIR